MSDEKLIVTKSKLDSLATSISIKSGVQVPMTIAQMKTAVDGIGITAQDQNGYIVLPTSGGGNTSPSTISSVNFSDTTGVKIDIDPNWFNDYSFIYIKLSATMSAKDWLYAIWNNTSGGTYSNNLSIDSCEAVLFKSKFGNICGMVDLNRGTAFTSTKTASYLYVHTYTNTVTMEGMYEIIGIHKWPTED